MGCSSSTPNGAAENSEPEAAKYPAGPLSFYFGSQTGTSEGMAKTMQEEAIRHGFNAKVVDLEDFDADELRRAGRAVFLMATYGEGEPTDNASKFSAWLRNEDGELPADTLADLQYAVFGLGNRQYEHYNRMGKVTDKGLEKLGASRMFRYGEGDDDGTLEEDFEAWRDELWPALNALFESVGDSAATAAIATGTAVAGNGKASPATAAAAAAAAAVAATAPPFSVRYLTPAEAVAATPTPASEAAASTRFYWEAREAKVVVNRELRDPADGGSTRHIEISLAGTGLAYCTADNLSVLPENAPDVVRRVAAQMKYNLASTFVLDTADGGGSGGGGSADSYVSSGGGSGKAVFPTPCTVEEALSRFVDLSGMPRRALLERLAPFCADEDERSRMAALAAKDGRDAFRSQVEEGHVGLGELLTTRFPSARVPLAALLHLAPSLHPRAYTIASSVSVHPGRAHLTVAVLRRARADGGGEFVGCCTRYLSELVPPATVDGKRVDGGENGGGGGGSSDGGSSSGGNGSNGNGRRSQWPTCRIFVKASTFRLPAEPSTPVVLIGPGTGVAPMRALLQERRFQRQTGGGGGVGGNGTAADVVGASVLFFGCRNRLLDFIYREDLEEFAADGTLSALHLAFSRDTADRKVYVQNRLAEEAAPTWTLLAAGAHVYVCGGTAMGADVMRQMRAVIAEHGGMDDGAAGRFLEGMREQGRYVQELWS
ncbi:unnamed protein product [Phaeothamnion confervicola]